MSSIASGTTTTTALVYTADTTGNLVLQTNGTTTAVTIGTNQVATFASGIALNGATAAGGGSSITLPSGYAYSWAGGNDYLTVNTSSHLMSFVTNGTTQLNLDTSGNLGLGVTPTAVASYRVLDMSGVSGGYLSLQVSGTETANVYGNTGGLSLTAVGSKNIAFWNNGVNTMTLDNSGNLLVNTPSQLNSGKVCIVFNGSGTNGLTMQTTYGSTGSVYLGFYNSANTLAGYISQNGTTTVNYVTSSDARLKTNIVDADSAKAKIESIKIRKFDWVSGEHQDFGVIAQELFEVAPEAVSVAQTEEQLWGVDYSKLVPSLIKYVQEQQAIIQELSAKVTALEAKVGI